MGRIFLVTWSAIVRQLFHISWYNCRKTVEEDWVNEWCKCGVWSEEMGIRPSSAGARGVCAEVPEGTVRLQPNPAHGKVEVIADVELQG